MARTFSCPYCEGDVCVECGRCPNGCDDAYNNPCDWCEDYPMMIALERGLDERI